MPDISYCNPETFKALSLQLATKIDRNKYSSLYGIPRGGIHVAIILSGILDLPMIEKNDIIQTTLIIDDLIDSGKTRNKYFNNDFACLYVKSCAPPLQKTTHALSVMNNWIEFFWEREDEEQPAEDAVIRMMESRNLEITKENIMQLHLYIDKFSLQRKSNENNKM